MTLEQNLERGSHHTDFDPVVMGRLEAEWVKDAYISGYPEDNIREIEGLMYQFGLKTEDAEEAVRKRHTRHLLDIMTKKEMKDYYRILSNGSGLGFDYKLATDADSKFKKILQKEGLDSIQTRDSLCQFFSLIYNVSAESLKPAMNSRVEAFKKAELASQEQSIKERLSLWNEAETKFIEYYMYLKQAIKPS